MANDQSNLTTAPYPKHPKDIRVRIIQRSVDDDLVSEIETTAEIALSEKLNDYFSRLGGSSPEIVGVVLHLMTKEKVRIDFRDYIERLELMDPDDRISSAQAMTLLDDFVAGINTPENEDQEQGQTRKKPTQKIIVQPPKRARG